MKMPDDNWVLVGTGGWVEPPKQKRRNRRARRAPASRGRLTAKDFNRACNRSRISLELKRAAEMLLVRGLEGPEVLAELELEVTRSNLVRIYRAAGTIRTQIKKPENLPEDWRQFVLQVPPELVQQVRELERACSRALGVWRATPRPWEEVLETESDYPPTFPSARKKRA